MTEEKFQEFYENNYWKAYHYVYRKIGQRENAEDMVQEAFLSCYKEIGGYDETKSSLSTWFYVILNNRLKNYFRDRKVTYLFEDYAQTAAEDGMDLPFEAAYVQECRELAYELLMELPELNRRIVVYKYFMDLPHKDIAERTGLTEGNVRVILSRSLKKLRASLDGRQGG